MFRYLSAPLLMVPLLVAAQPAAPTPAVPPSGAPPPGWGLLTVQSKTPGDVLIDGAKIASTPLEDLPLRFGAYIVTVCFGEGDCAPSQTVRLSEDGPARLAFDATPKVAGESTGAAVVDQPDALLNAAIADLGGGRRGLAIERLRRVVELAPSVAAHSLLCSAYRDEKAFAEAVQHCREAHRLDKDPRNQRLWEKKVGALEALLGPAPAKVATPPSK